MRTIIFLVFLTIISPSCAQQISQGERIANKLANEQVEHAEYIRTRYGATNRSEAIHANHAIRTANIINPSYDRLNAKILEDKGEYLVENMARMKTLLISQLDNYQHAWSLSIRYGHSSGPSAVNIIIYEHIRLGVFGRIESIKEELKKEVSILDRNKYPNSLEIYSIINQLIDLAESPRGSLNSFSQTIAELDGKFSRALSLAELE